MLQLPPDALKRISQPLNLKELSNLRTTCKEMIAVEQLKAMQDLDLQRANTLETAFSPIFRDFSDCVPIFRTQNELAHYVFMATLLPIIPLLEISYKAITKLVDTGPLKRTQKYIPELIIELKNFTGELQESFFQKNIAEIKENAQFLENRLEAEKLETGKLEALSGFDKNGEDLELMYSFTAAEATFIRESIHQIKLCMVEQHHLLAESDQYENGSLERSFLNQIRQNKVLDKLHSKSSKIDDDFFRSAHAYENAAALFISRPQKIQAYLAQRQHFDLSLLKNHLKKSSFF
ncbi:MAG: hypothetical protein K0R08_1649 [Solimicrobium sp.]|jgi:hypothetical protein|nr:hypothetical protein [Solimicrobium sp.]